MTKLYGILSGKCNPGMQNKVQRYPDHDTNSDSFDCPWLMEKLNLNSSGIAHISNPFYMDFHGLKGVFNLCQVQTESMDYFCKRFGSDFITCKFTGCDANSFSSFEEII